MSFPTTGRRRVRPANQNETCWVKLPNDTIITIDTGSTNTEHYVPSLNSWVTDGNLPVPLYGYAAELGAGFVLPNGKVFLHRRHHKHGHLHAGRHRDERGKLGGKRNHSQRSGRGGRAGKR